MVSKVVIDYVLLKKMSKRLYTPYTDFRKNVIFTVVATFIVLIFDTVLKFSFRGEFIIM